MVEGDDFQLGRNHFTAAMKCIDADMQDCQTQPSSQVKTSDHGTPDRGIMRNRDSDCTSNINSATTGSPEVIDLDEEDSPGGSEEVPFPVNGVTTVKKVSLPWERNINLNKINVKSSESSVECTAADSPTSEKGSIASKEFTTPAEADEAVSNHAVEGERKRSTPSSTIDCDPKRPKLDSNGLAKVPSTKVGLKESDGKESPKPSPKNSLEVSVVDLVEDDDEQVKVNNIEERDKSSTSDGPVKGDTQAASDSKPSAVTSRKSDSPVLNGEVRVPLSVAITAASQAVASVPASISVTMTSVPTEEKRTSRSAIISSGKNGLISPMQSIEVKRVKLCPQLEKQATAMSPLPMTPAVATPKQSTGASIVQIPVSITASTPEATEIPSVASSKALESAKEVVKEGEAVLVGAELEKKKGLNPVHSETRKMVKKLTRSELESFFMELACELIISKSDAGRYRQLYEEMKESCENKANKIAQMNKQLVDLSAVVHRAINDSKEKKDSVPLKVTRSVGLQLEQNQILAAMKNRTREERSFVSPPSTISSSSNSSSVSDRIPPAKYGRAYPASRTTPPSTPNGIGSSGVKDLPTGVPAPAKSPQRQLKALHPRVPPSAGQGVVHSPSNPHPPTLTPAQTTPDSASKRLGFIDIADEKLINSGAQIGIRRHRAPAVIVSTTPNCIVSSSTPLSTLNSTQVMAPALKVVPSHYPHPATIPGSNYPPPGGNTRVVTAATIPVAPGTPISSSRLTYIIPTSSPLAGQPRQLLLTSAAQSQQIRGRSPVTSMPAMLMRPNATTTTLVQVQPGSIPNTPPALIRAVQPGTSHQVLGPVKTPSQQQASRMMGIPNRPSQTPPKVSTQHPAPLPAQPQPTVVNANLKPIPRRPVLKLSKVMNGIVLSWNMTTTTPHEEIASYQLYAYQEGANAPPSPSLWKKVGDVKALPLPMACTLTQFADGHTYHFAVRAVDVHGRVGEFSVPGTIELFS